MDTNQNQRPQAEPVVQMIREEAAARGLTHEDLAAATGQSKGRTGDVLRGYGPRRADGTYPETGAQALILARLAQRAGVSAERVRQAGRDDVAALMEAAPTLTDTPTADLVREVERRLRIREGVITSPAVDGAFQCSYCGVWHHGSDRTYCDSCAAHPHHQH